MPNVAAHRRQVLHNRKVRLLLHRAAQARGGCGSAVRDWVVTLLFYEALHAVEARLVPHYGSSADHKARNQRVAKTLPRIFAQYKDLYELSRRARYQCVPISDAELRQARMDLAAVLKATW